LRDDLGVVHQPVDHGGDDVVAEHLAPAAEHLVAGDDQAGAFVAGGHQLEEQVRRFGLERDVSHLVDNQQRVAAQPDQFGLQGAAVVGGGEPVDPLGGGGEQHPVPGLASPNRQPDRQMGLAGAGRAEEHHVLASGDEVQGAQVRDRVAFEASAGRVFAMGEP
jgi:hypothetical protein